MRVGLDLDGVIYHWTKSAISWLNYRTPPPFQLDEEWEPNDWYAIQTHFETYDKKLWARMWDEGVRDVFSNAKPFFGAKQFVETLLKDHDVRVITLRPEKVRYLTIVNWIADFGGAAIPSFFFPSDRRITSKGELDCDVFIEDHPQAHFLPLAWGTPVVLLSRAYNSHIDSPNVFRAGDYVEALNLIAKIERGELKK